MERKPKQNQIVLEIFVSLAGLGWPLHGIFCMGSQVTVLEASPQGFFSASVNAMSGHISLFPLAARKPRM